MADRLPGRGAASADQGGRTKGWGQSADTSALDAGGLDHGYRKQGDLRTYVDLAELQRFMEPRAT
jgi:hypothetical protein